MEDVLNKGNLSCDSPSIIWKPTKFSLTFQFSRLRIPSKLSDNDVHLPFWSFPRNPFEFGYVFVKVKWKLWLSLRLGELCWFLSSTVFLLHFYDLSFPPTISHFISFDILKYLAASPPPPHLSQMLLASRVSCLPYSVVCFLCVLPTQPSQAPNPLYTPPHTYTDTDTRVLELEHSVVGLMLY